MSALVIRNLADELHATVRRVAVERHMSVEALARQALADLAASCRQPGIDFTKLTSHRVVLGCAEDGPVWDDRSTIRH